MLLILERKNPSINAVVKVEDSAKKRKQGHESTDHHRAADPSGNKKKFSKSAEHSDFNQRLQVLKIANTVAKKPFKANKGGKAAAYGDKGGSKGKKPNTGRFTANKGSVNIDELCWGCGSKDHMRKHCKAV